MNLLSRFSLRPKLTVFSIALLLGFSACKPAVDPNDITDDDMKVSVSSLDFGDIETEKTFTITGPTIPVGGSGKVLNFVLSKTKPWLSVDVEKGSGTRTVKVSINRALLEQGISRDTIKILGTGGLHGGTTTQSIPVSASSAAATVKTSMTALYQQLIANGVQLPPGLDSAASLNAAVRIQSQMTSTPVLTAFGAHYANMQFLVNAGTVSVRAGTSSIPRMMVDSVALTAASFSYTNPISGAASTGTYYSAVVASPELLKFDGTTQQKFNIYGTSTFPAYKDSVLSVVPPAISSPSSGGSASRSANLTVSWAASADAGDSVYAAIVSTTDPTKIGTTLPVPDANGSLIISSSLMSRLPAGGASLLLMRYRTTTRIPQGASKRIILSLSQIGIPVTLQ